MKVWHDYKPFIKSIQDVLKIKSVVDKSFKAGGNASMLVDEVNETYRKMFKQIYGSDKKLYEYLS